MNALRGIALAGFCCLIAWPLSARAQDIQIDHYKLISSKRLSRTIYGNTYKADVRNGSDADLNIAASLSSTSTSIVVADGSLSFGDVPAGATVQSNDTFSLRVDRRKPFDLSALQWSPQTTPLPPTSFALIDQALAAGTIDADAALLFKVYVEFDDSALPAEYRGRDDGFFEARAVLAAMERFDTLSPDTQQLIAPFLREPDAPGSWYEQRAANQLGHPVAVESGAAAQASAINWTSVDTLNGKVQVWWDGVHVADGIDALGIANAIDTKIWPKLTGLLGEPLPDTDGVFYGPDKVPIPNIKDDQRLDIFLTDSPRVYASANGCKSGVAAAFINLGAAGSNRSYSSVVHELTHAILYRFPLKTGCDNTGYRWMHDATAEWAMQYIYPKSDGLEKDPEHRVAPYLLSHPDRPLEYEEAGGPEFYEHPYGAYLWFFDITGGTDSGAILVRKTWDAVSTNDSLGAINSAIAGLGGLKEEWPNFALNNWNRTPAADAPYRRYWEWDELGDQSKEDVAEAPSLGGKVSKIFKLPHRIAHLSAEYFHYDFTGDPKIRSLVFTQPYADGSEPTARVSAIVKIHGQKWKPAEDWTSFETKYLCFDRPAENVEELIIVISNSEFKNRNHFLTDLGDLTQLKVSAIGCQPFVGTVDFERTIQQDNPPYKTDMSESAKTNVTFDSIDPDKIKILFPEYIQLFKISAGFSAWSHAGSFSVPGQTCSGQGSGSVGVVPTNENPNSPHLYLYINPPPPLSDGVTTYYEAFGRVEDNMPTTYTCAPASDLEIGFGYGEFFDWLKTRPPEDQPLTSYQRATLDPADGGVVLEGEYSDQDGDLQTLLIKRKWHWKLKQPPKAR